MTQEQAGSSAATNDYGSPGPAAEVIHLCPHGDKAVTACCARLVFELPRYHRMTTDPRLVTCGA